MSAPFTISRNSAGSEHGRAEGVRRDQEADSRSTTGRGARTSLQSIAQRCLHAPATRRPRAPRAPPGALAPGVPRRARTSASSRRISPARTGSVRMRNASSATRAGEIVLDELGNDSLAGDEVGHRKRVDADEPAAEPISQRRQPIDDDHRALVERSLHRHRARRHQRHVGDGQHVIGASLDDQRRSDRSSIERLEQARRRRAARAPPRTAPPGDGGGSRRAAATRPGRMAATSLRRLPGSSATTGSRGPQTEIARQSPASAAAPASRRAADGRPTRPARPHPDKCAPRTEK